MQVAAIVRITGHGLLVESAALVLPTLLAVVAGEPALGFAAASAGGLAVGVASVLATRGRDQSVAGGGALASAVALFVAAATLGSVPFALAPDLGLTVVDAFYESMAAFTGSGSSLLAGRAGVPGAIVLWRSLAGWLGGFAAILLGLAVLPALGVAGLELLPRALPGVASDRLPTRVLEAARVCLPLWIGLTLLAALLFALAGMGPIDALTSAMACLSTGVLLAPPEALRGFATPVAIGALLAGAIGMPLAHRALAGTLAWSREPELRALVGVFAVATAVIALDLRYAEPVCHPTAAVALQSAALRSAALVSTTGVPLAGCGELPPLSTGLLGVLLVVGGMAGSASGGLRLGRLLLLVRAALAHFFRLVHPRGFLAPRVEQVVIEGLAGFLVLWLAVLVVGASLLAAQGVDLRASYATAAAALANSDAAWGGYADEVAALSTSGKLVLAALMLLGRLEIFCVLVLFTPSFWRR
jgi:trk system potassium uptake protein TrkH